MRVIVMLVGLVLCLVGTMQTLDAVRSYNADAVAPLVLVGLGVLCILGAAG